MQFFEQKGAEKLSVGVLALSVTFGDSSPKGRAIGRPGHFLLDARGPI